MSDAMLANSVLGLEDGPSDEALAGLAMIVLMITTPPEIVALFEALGAIDLSTPKGVLDAVLFFDALGV